MPFDVEVSCGHGTKDFSCSTRRELFSAICRHFELQKDVIKLIDKDTDKPITINEVCDKMKLEIKLPTSNGERSEMSEKQVKVPNQEQLVNKLKQNSTLNGLERQYIIAILEKNKLESANNLKRKHEDEPRSTANKKVQVCREEVNFSNTYTQTEEKFIKPQSTVNRPSTSKDWNYECKRLALEEKWDKKKIAEVMKNTFTERRQFILKDNPVVLLVKQNYPLLFCVSEVRNEINRIFYDGKDREFLQNIKKYADSILKLVDEEDKFLKFVKNKIKSAKTPVQMQYAKEVGALLIVTNLAKEKRLYLDTENEPIPSSEKNNYPRIEAPCTVDKIFNDEQMYRVVVENVELCQASNFQEAVLCLMASFFIFNISYPQSVFNTLVIFERILLEANDTDGNEIDSFTLQLIKLIQLKSG